MGTVRVSAKKANEVLIQGMRAKTQRFGLNGSKGREDDPHHPGWEPLYLTY